MLIEIDREVDRKIIWLIDWYRQIDRCRYRCRFMHNRTYIHITCICNNVLFYIITLIKLIVITSNWIYTTDLTNIRFWVNVTVVLLIGNCLHTWINDGHVSCMNGREWRNPFQKELEESAFVFQPQLPIRWKKKTRENRDKKRISREFTLGTCSKKDVAFTCPLTKDST